jgi:hypothetical protein
MIQRFAGLVLCLSIAACARSVPAATETPAAAIDAFPLTTDRPAGKTPSPAPGKNDVEVILRPNPQNNLRTDVFLRTVATGEEIFFITLDDVIREYYHAAEYHNGSLYIIRRMGNTGADNPDWSDELWRYDSRGQGTKLYSKQGLDFRVAPDEKNIAVCYVDVWESVLFFLDPAGKPVREFLPDPGDKPGSYYNWPLQWSDDSSTFWGVLAIRPAPQFFYKITAVDWRIEEFPVALLGIGDEYDLNPNTGKLVYSNYPIFYDADLAQKFKDSGKKVQLYVYDLTTKVRQLVAVSKVKEFHPKWVDDRTVEYDDPNADRRITAQMA